MEKFLNWIETKFMPPMAKLSEQRHLRAIRDGIISTLALIIVGSFFIIIAQPPVDSLKQLVAPYVGKIMMPFRITMGLMSVYAAYGMGYSLAKSYKLDGVTGGVLSLCTFFMTVIPLNLDATLPKGQGVGWILPMANLGGAGMFVAILAMIISVETLRIFKQKHITISMPEQVPESVARSFEALMPAAFLIIVVWVVRVLLDFDINKAIMSLFTPINGIVGNSWIGVVLPVILITLLWSAGIHGVSIIGSVLRPLWLVMIDANAKAVGDGLTSLPYVAPEQFYQWFVWIGGSGATLGLCILLVFSKSEYLKKVGRFSIVPGIFNINEPLIFGVPIVMNPILAIPFILAPTVTTSLSYFAIKFGLVAGVSVMPPWTLPAPIGAYLATSGDWRAVVLCLLNIGLAMCIYYPFFKAYEKKMILEENAQLAENQRAGVQA